MPRALLILALGTSVATSPSAARTFVSQVNLSTDAVALRDVADFKGIPASVTVRISGVILGRFGPGQMGLLLQSEQICERVRSEVPAAAPWFSACGRNAIVAIRKPVASHEEARPAVSCMATVVAIPADAYPGAADLRPAPCDAVTPGFRYDNRARFVRAERDFKPGEVVPAVPDFALAGLTPGQLVYLRAQAGPVTVTRSFEVVQPVRNGQFFFAKAQDGQIVTLPYPRSEP